MKNEYSINKIHFRTKPQGIHFTPTNDMNEINYPWDELTDDFLHAQADVGECLLDEEGFQYRPTQNEMKQLALEGISLLFIDCLKGK